MCGIAGLSIESESTIRTMVECLRHRGPDGNACWMGEGASLGHARLAVLDPRPIGDQPMWNDAHTCVMVYNGEIYNFKELREQEGFQCKTNTDTEVLLKLYEKYGDRFVEKLRGMFVFGLYDTRSETFILARDTHGINPIFYTTLEGHLAFGSEMRAVLKSLKQKPKINEKSLSQYLRLQYVPGPETMCEGIFALQPGTILTWKDGAMTLKHFVSDVPPHAAFRSQAEFQEAFPTIMEDSVLAHMIADRPIGLFLSGGMDSSIVLHHMAKLSSHPVETFTVRFEATEEEGAERFNKDADLAAMTAKHYGTHHHEILLTAELFKDLYLDTARSLDQPNSDHVSVAQFLLSREAKKHVDVALTGAGGDELFGGYPRYRIARILKLIGFIPAGLRSALGALTTYPSDVLGMKPGPKLAERLLARPAAEIRSIARGDWFDAKITTHLFAERFAQLKGLDSLRQFEEFDRHLWLVDECLRLTNATTMGSGLEGRVPFIDSHIVAAAHATKSTWHVTPTVTKALLKKTYRPLLPEHLFTLDKASFYPPLAKWLRRQAWPLVEQMLEHPRIKERFDIEPLRTIAVDHRDHRTYNLHILSSLIQLSHWFDAVYDA
jgi:asparagine synthase (glutamine-hydrolysing)